MIRSIPTTYNGVQFRSRLEADFARALDTARCDWQYEPQSFLLPSGVHFWPDFYVQRTSAWIEVRGYSSEHGEQQIREFPKVIAPHESFIVVRANGGFEAIWASEPLLSSAVALSRLCIHLGHFCGRRHAVAETEDHQPKTESSLDQKILTIIFERPGISISDVIILIGGRQRQQVQARIRDMLTKSQLLNDGTSSFAKLRVCVSALTQGRSLL